MDVVLLYFEPCPNWKQLAALLDTVASERPGLRVVHHIVDTDREGERIGFRGSPTILVDGADPFPVDDGAPIGLSCRRYLTPNGPAGTRDVIPAAR